MTIAALSWPAAAVYIALIAAVALVVAVVVARLSERCVPENSPREDGAA
jgi:TRAP-type C4-dicarboxylate transport system permease small subunit